jgi:O-antigen ligase
MGFLNAPIHPPPKPWREDPIGRAFGLILLAVLGALLGIQFWTPNKRVIPVVAVALVFGVAWRLSMAAAVNVLVFVLPYPKGTVFGSTNLAFILVVLVIWLLRLSLRTTAPARSSPLDLPILGMLLWGILSFYNVRMELVLAQALQNFVTFVACVVLYYLIINCVRTQADLQRLHAAQLVTALSVFLVATWELHNPEKVLIPGLLDFSGTHGNEFNTINVRVGASFRDYELLSEYCGLLFLFMILQLVRARSQTRRALLGVFCLFNVYTLFTTVTRGVIVSLAATLPYVFFVVRRRLNPIRFMAAVSLILALAIGMNFVVAHYTNSGNLFERLSETKVVHGFVPVAREGTWTNGWNRALVHPILGQGPYYGEIPGYTNVWPHNVYLFIANLYGFPGLGFYLMLLAGLVMILRPVVDDLRHESYADAYLIIARAQLFMFMINELKIDYLRNPIYQFQVWQFFGMWTAAYLVSREHGVRAGFFVAQPHEPPGRRLAA